LSVSFEQPKSSPPAQAAPLNAGSAIAAAINPLPSKLFMSDLPLLFSPTGRGYAGRVGGRGEWQRGATAAS
jgi:hypothetical protein